MTAQRRQFLAALTLAAIYKAPTLSLWQMIGAAWRIGIAMLGLGKRVGILTYSKRITTCEACPIYFSVLKTCGSPLVDPELGCFCYQPKRCALANADCWARENNIPDISGWPDAIRPKH